MFLRLAVVFFANQIVRSGWFGRSPLCNLPTFVVCPPFASCDTGGRSFFKYDISSPLDRCFRSMGLNRVFSVASACCARPRGQKIEEFQKVASPCQIPTLKKDCFFSIILLVISCIYLAAVCLPPTFNSFRNVCAKHIFNLH
jgi:hypothetical protein